VRDFGFWILDFGLRARRLFRRNPTSKIQNPKSPARPAEAGQITLEYVLILAIVILPLVSLVFMLWRILLYFYWNTALVVSIPYL
jgi:hypothetical protein